MLSSFCRQTLLPRGFFRRFFCSAQKQAEKHADPSPLPKYRHIQDQIAEFQDK
jgi:hypothetical protein